MKLPIAFVPLLAGLTLAAQTPAPAEHSSNRNSMRQHQDSMFQRFSARLNLTADQQSKAKAIFKDSREQANGLRAKLRAEDTALSQAVKTDSEQQIDHITQQNAQLNAQVEAIHVKAMAKVYAILTPDQKAKYDQRVNRMTGMRHERRRGGVSPTPARS